MAETPDSSFVMQGARSAIAGGLEHLEQNVAAIELAVVENPGLVFDLAKSLVEAVCRVVLVERSIQFSEVDDLPKLFKAASQALPFLPPAANSEADVRKSLARTLGGLSAAIHGICELRNRCGFASHGSATPRPPMETTQALLAAKAADTIVGFIYGVHRQDQAAPRPAGVPYHEKARFNDYVDEIHDAVRIFDEEFLASRVLFEMAPEPYRMYSGQFEVEAEEAGSDGAPGIPSESSQ